MTFRRALTLGAVVGGGVPVLCWAANYFLKITFGRWTTYIWPSSALMMATDGHERSLFSLLLVCVAVLANVVLYMLVGALIWYVTRALQRGATTP